MHCRPQRREEVEGVKNASAAVADWTLPHMSPSRSASFVPAGTRSNSRATRRSGFSPSSCVAEFRLKGTLCDVHPRRTPRISRRCMIFDGRSMLEAPRRAWHLLPSDLLPDPALFALISIFSTAVSLQAVVCWMYRNHRLI
jgi:hypothetical protein